MAPGYGINSIGSYASDPYFMYALNSYNPNFMGTQQTPAVSQPQNYTIEQPAVTTTAPSFKGSDDEKESSNAGLIVGGTVVAGAATLIYAAKKGNGKGIKEGFKNILRGLTGKGTEKAAQEAAEKATKAMKEFSYKAKDGSIVYVKDGKIAKVAIKGEDKVLDKAGEINKYIADNGVTIPNAFTGSKLTDGVNLTKYQFTHNKKTYTVENGEIISIEVGGKKVNKDKVSEFLEKMNATEKGQIDNKIAKVQSGEKAKGLIDNSVQYTWVDDAGVIYTRGYNRKGALITNKINVPGEINHKPAEAEWKAWLNKNSDVDNQVRTLIEKGRVDGVKVGNFKYTDKNGNVISVNEKGEITRIQLKKAPKKGAPTDLKPETTEFDAWLYDNKEVKEAVKKEFESGLAPDGARFVAA